MQLATAPYVAPVSSEMSIARPLSWAGAGRNQNSGIVPACRNSGERPRQIGHCDERAGIPRTRTRNAGIPQCGRLHSIPGIGSHLSARPFSAIPPYRGGFFTSTFLDLRCLALPSSCNIISFAVVMHMRPSAGHWKPAARSIVRNPCRFDPILLLSRPTAVDLCVR